MLRKSECRGQMLMEYVAIIIILIGALLAMQNYFKRGIQGRMKSSIDSVGDQYDPMTTDTDITQRAQGRSVTTITVEEVGAGEKQTMRFDNSSMTETKSGTTRVDAY